MYLQIERITKEELTMLKRLLGEKRVKEINVYKEICNIEAACALENEERAFNLTNVELESIAYEISEKLEDIYSNSTFSVLSYYAEDEVDKYFNNK